MNHKTTGLLSHLPLSDDTITLRIMKHSDAQAYAVSTEDEQIRRFGHLPLPRYTATIVNNLIDGPIAQGLRDGNLAVLTISDSQSDAFIGSLVLFDITAEEAEIGYWVAAPHRGQNISGKAIALGQRVAAQSGLKRLRARTVHDNPASIAVLQKAGFVQTGDVRPEITPSGKTELSIHFLLTLSTRLQSLDCPPEK